MQILDELGNFVQDDSLVPLVVDSEGLVNFFLKQTSEDTEYYLEFKVFEVNGWVENKSTGVYDVPCDLELYLAGTIKWDGCSHIYFGEAEENGDPSGYLHLCGKGYWQKHCQVMNEVYAYAEKTIKKFDSSVAT